VAGLAAPESIVNPDGMFAEKGIDLVVGTAEEVDARRKSVRLAGGRTLPYDKLVLGTGARAVRPPLAGMDLHGVFTLRSLRHAERIRSFLDEAAPRRLVFIGSGFISLEVASLLAKVRPDAHEITVVEILDHPLPLMLDPELGAEVREYLEAHGLAMRMGRRVERILGQDDVVSAVELDDGERIDADMVLMCVGAAPNLDLARQADLEIGAFGVKVNGFMETSDPDILAAGDCTEVRHFITGKPAPGPLRGPAVIQGRLVAKRLAGYEIAFPGILNNSACKLFDASIAATGLTETQAQAEDIETVCATVVSRSKHGMIRGARPWTLKLVFDRKTRKLIGGQILSESEAPAKEIDTVNALILGGRTVEDLTTLTCAGNPDLSSEPSLEPMSIAAEQVLRKL
jgi:NADPH-dependent 2,4-dienoyl-CoA reductase/sulfur reductase-like enzyme